MRKLIVITPVRDEEKYLARTAESMVKQTARPLQWIIVNDGSQDRTGVIAEEIAKKKPWIMVIHRNDRGHRDSAGGEISAFYYGSNAIVDKNWDFICKLDGDLSFEPNYFEECLNAFQRDSKLGISGGKIYNVVGGRNVYEPHPRFHVRGAVKIYRRDCWESIGGLVCRPGWDTLDEVKAQFYNWRTYTLPNVPVLHHRVTGAAVGSWKNAVKDGVCNYTVGYHPLYMAAKCCKKAFQKPFVIRAAGLWCGFIKGYFTSMKRISSKEIIRYVHNQQLRKMLGRDTIWR